MGRLSLFIRLLREKWWPEQPSLPYTSADLTGKIIIITGANTGLGFATARELYAMRPARLILAVRNLAQGEHAKTLLLQNTGNRAESAAVTSVEVWKLDMANFASVSAFATRCEAELVRLDIAVLNAGIAGGTRYSTTVDGWEAV